MAFDDLQSKGTERQDPRLSSRTWVLTGIVIAVLAIIIALFLWGGS